MYGDPGTAGILAMVLYPIIGAVTIVAGIVIRPIRQFFVSIGKKVLRR